MSLLPICLTRKEFPSALWSSALSLIGSSSSNPRNRSKVHHTYLNPFAIDTRKVLTSPYLLPSVHLTAPGEVDDGESTGNLVGQLCAHAHVATDLPSLKDPTKHMWFAFANLSVRTEGVFRIRFRLSMIPTQE